MIHSFRNQERMTSITRIKVHMHTTYVDFVLRLLLRIWLDNSIKP